MKFLKLFNTKQKTVRDDYGTGTSTIDVKELNPLGIGIWVMVALLALIFGLGGLYTNNPGEGSVEFNRWTGDYDTTDEGMHWRFLMSTSKETYDVKERIATSSESAAAQDGLPIEIEVSVRYSLDRGSLETIHKTLGEDYFKKVIEPAVKEAIKSCSTGQEYTTLLRERAAVGQCTEDIVSPRLDASGINTHEVDLRDISPPASVRQSIERVQAAEQEAEEEENRLRATQARADQVRAEADGQAYAAEVLASIPNAEVYTYLEWLAVWDGKLPTVMAGPDTQFLIPTP